MLMTIEEVEAIKRPGSPIDVQSGYWKNMLIRGNSAVKGITSRNLYEKTYEEIGNTDENMILDKYAYYLEEPTGEPIEFTDFETMELNGVPIVSGDVIIQDTRLLFNSPGEVRVKYAGGYMANLEAAAVIKSAVVRCMEIFHQMEGNAGVPGSLTIDEALEPVREILYDYTAVRVCVSESY